MSRIKIAFFSDVLVRDFDGALRTVFNIIDRIPDDIFEIEFFCGMAPTDHFPYKVHRLPTIKIPLNSSYQMVLPQLVKKKLNNVLEDFDPDIIHVTTPSPMGNFAVKYGNKHQIPVSTIYHTHFISYVDYYFRYLPFLIPWARRRSMQITKSIYDGCDRIFVPTKEMIKDLGDAGAKTDNMVLWPRGIDKSIFHPERANRQKLHKVTGNDYPNVLFASRLVWEKNLKTLIRFYKLVQKEKLKLNLILAGDGVARKDLENKMPEAFFLGNVNQTELAEIYASSDVFLFPSISETYGNVVIEAMSCGLPCVIANGGGSKSFIDHGENGFLCKPNEEQEYLDYVKRIINNPELRQTLRQNSLHYVKDLSWSALIKEYFNQLVELHKRNSDQTEAA